MPRILLLPLAAVLALSATGCVQIAGETSEQLDLIGDVAVHTDLCSEERPTYDRRAARACGVNDIGRAQLLIAYRVPDGAEPVAMRLSPTDSLAAELEARHPTGDDARWVAYAGEARDYGFARVSGTVDARFALPPGAPFRGPFAYRTVVGYRTLGADEDGTAPVDCGSPTTECETAASERTQPTRDLAILPGDEVVVAAGERGEVPYRAVFAGAGDAGLDFALTAAGERGFTAAPREAVLHPVADSETPLAVTVVVAPDAEPGRRRVRLTARLANGQQRSGEATFVVRAAKKPENAKTATPAAEPPPPQPAATRSATADATPSLAVESSRRCLSRRVVAIRLRRRGRNDTAAVRRVRVNGRDVPFTPVGRTRLRVDLRGLAKSAYAIRIAARLADGSVLVDRRRYRTCTPKRARRLPRLAG